MPFQQSTTQTSQGHRQSWRGLSSCREASWEHVPAVVCDHTVEPWAPGEPSLRNSSMRKMPETCTCWGPSSNPSFSHRRGLGQTDPHPVLPLCDLAPDAGFSLAFRTPEKMLWPFEHSPARRRWTVHVLSDPLSDCWIRRVWASREFLRACP